MGEKKSIEFVNLFDDKNIKLIQRANNHFSNCKKKIIQKNPWHLPTSIPVKNFDALPFKNFDGTYGISYYFEGIAIFISYNKQSILFSYSLDLNLFPKKEDISLICNWYDSCQFVLLGFELDLFIDDISGSKERMLNRTDYYPLIYNEGFKLIKYQVKSSSIIDERLDMLNKLFSLFAYS